MPALVFENKILTLTYTLPLKTPAAANRSFGIEIGDPTYFVAFDIVDAADAVITRDAPQGCVVRVARPPKLDTDDPAEAGAGRHHRHARCERPTRSRPARWSHVPERRRVPPRCHGRRCRAASSSWAWRSPLIAGALALLAALHRSLEPASSAAAAQSLRHGPAARGAAFDDRHRRADPVLAIGLLSRADGDAEGDPRRARPRCGPALALAFGYGVFHAAGPGHGKAVISGYIVADNRSLRRGLGLSFAAAILQALVAIAMVGAMTLALRTTAATMNVADHRDRAGELRPGRAGRPAGALAQGRRAAGARPMAQPAHDPACDHVHMPGPDAVARLRNWREMAGVVFAAGLRPCAGALIILVFAASQGLLWAGIAATFAMALGTALTTGALAALAVFFKFAALRIAGGGSPARRAIDRGAGIAGRGLRRRAGRGAVPRALDRRPGKLTFRRQP